MSFRIRSCSVLMATLACIAWGTLCAQAKAVMRFEMPTQPLQDSLRAVGSQTHTNILFDAALVAGRTAPALKGEMSTDKALTRLLNGTGIKYQFLNDSTVVLESSSAPATPATTLQENRTQDSAIREAGTSPSRDLRLAQVDRTAPPGGDSTAPSPTAATESDSRAQLEEVVVTGSHIRGVRNDTAPILSFDHEYLERSGFSDMAQFAQSLPQNFLGGNSGSSETAAFGNAANSGQNLTRGTGFNLRGLGSVSTLTLINGRRVAPSAEGQFVDISNIPLAAVERVEILTDSASAIYGADAVAGVVNIILRKNFDGAETQVSYGEATRGGTSEEHLSQTFGTSWSGGDALVVADLHNRDPLDARDRDFIVAAGGAPPNGPTYLLPPRKSASLVFNLDQTLPAGFDLASNILYSHERVHQAQSYSDDSIYTNDPVTNQESGLLALGYKPFDDWRFELDGSIARVETVTDLTQRDIPTGYLYYLANDYRDRFDTWEADLKGDGSLFNLPAGKVRVALGASYRYDRANSTRNRIVPAQGLFVRARDKRNVSSAYIEMFIPVVGEEQKLLWARRIELSIAGRYDDYSDFGSSTNPKVGFVFTPIDSLDVRATWGTSFRAPSVAEKALYTRGVTLSNGLVDAPGGGEVAMFQLLGSAPLTAEKSRETALGFTFHPEAIRNAELTFNYFAIDYRGRISLPPFEQDTLLHSSDFAGLITPIPNDAAAQAYLSSQLAAGALFFDVLGTGAQDVRYLFDLRQQNAAHTKTNGFDVTASYALVRAVDRFDFNLNFTRLNTLLTSLTENSTAFNEINTYEQPLKTRARAMTSWIRGGWNSTLALNYWNSYENASISPHERIKAWFTTDLTVSYDFGTSNSSAVLRGARASLSITNLFDVNPPSATDPFYSMGFDVFNGDALGRYATLKLAKRW